MLTGVYETLRSAGRPLVLELATSGRGSRSGSPSCGRPRAASPPTPAATELQRDERRGGARAGVAETTLPERLLDLAPLRARGERAAATRRRARRVEQAALDELAARDRELLQELLTRLRRGRTRRRRSASRRSTSRISSSRARDLLRDHDGAPRAREQLRFRSIMVDEFQDTNRLQCELIDLLASGPGERELFFVGDEFQSIYGFRHADVARLPRAPRAGRRGAAADAQLPLAARGARRRQLPLRRRSSATSSSRSRPSGEFPDPVFGSPVELLVTDKASYADTGVHWRRAEARHVARRVRELVDTGAATPGEIVLLFAAGTDAEWYEEELRARRPADLSARPAAATSASSRSSTCSRTCGCCRTATTTRRSSTVLASPFVGVSQRRARADAAPRGPAAALHRARARRSRRISPTRTSGSCARSGSATSGSSAASARLSLERLCEQIVAEHDYDLAVLAQWDGRRRYANLRKLARLARSYEELRGRDVEGFVRFVARAGGGRRDASSRRSPRRRAPTRCGC